MNSAIQDLKNLYATHVSPNNSLGAHNGIIKTSLSPSTSSLSPVGSNLTPPLTPSKATKTKTKVEKTNEVLVSPDHPPIGPSTLNRIKTSSTLAALQLQITNQDLKISRMTEQFDSLFSYLTYSHTSTQNTAQINNASMSTTTERNVPQENDINLSSLPSNIINFNPNALVPTYTSKELNYLLEQSIPITNSVTSLTSYNISLTANNNHHTPASLMNDHEGHCELHNVHPQVWPQLLMANIRKHSKELYLEFLEKTELPRALGKGKRDNPSALEFLNWSWKDFRLSFISIFEDSTLSSKITMFMSSWGSETFKTPRDTIKCHLLLMKDLQYSKDNLSLQTPLSLLQLCSLHVGPLRASLSQDLADKLAIFVTMRNSVRGSLPIIPSNITDMSYEVLTSLLSDFSSHRTRNEAFFALHKQKSQNSTTPSHKPIRVFSMAATPPAISSSPSPDAGINAISSSRDSSEQKPFCEYCNRSGHLQSGCFTKNPELIKKFTCKICNQIGHFPSKCPSKSSQ